MHNNTWDHNTSLWEGKKKRSKNCLSLSSWEEKKKFCRHLVICLPSPNSGLWRQDSCFQTSHQCTRQSHTHKHFLPAHTTHQWRRWKRGNSSTVLRFVLFFFLYRGRATVLGAVNLTEVQKNTPSQRPKLATMLSYSCRLYVIIAWQHTKIKEVALVHIVTSPALGVWLCLFAKGRACVRHTQKYHRYYFERNEAGSVTIHLASGCHHISTLSILQQHPIVVVCRLAFFFFSRASLGNAYLEIPWEFFFFFWKGCPSALPLNHHFTQTQTTRNKEHGCREAKRSVSDWL